MSAQTIKAGRAAVEVFLDTSGLQSGLRGMGSKLKTAGSMVAQAGATVTGVGASILAPLLGAAASFAKAGDVYSKLSDKTGASVESLSQLGYAAKISGASVESLGTGFRGMNRVIGEAADGSTTAVDALAKLGTTSEELQGMTPDKRFELIADRINAIQDPSLRAAAAMDVFGRAGTDLLPMMAGGAQGIAELRAKADELGLTMSSSDAAGATALGDAWTDTTEQLSQAKNMIGAALAPSLTDLLASVTPILASAIDWVSNNRELVVWIAKLAAGLVIAGGIITTVGGALALAGMAASGLATIIGGLGTVLGIVVSPLGLLVGLAVAAGVALYKMGELDGLISGFKELGAILGTTFDGLTDAIAAGDWQAAGDVVMAGLNAAWQTGKAKLIAIWSDIKVAMIEAFAGGVIAVYKMWSDLQNKISNMIIEWSMQDGAVGAAARLVLGTDLRDMAEGDQRRAADALKNSIDLMYEQLEAIESGARDTDLSRQAVELQATIDGMYADLAEVDAQAQIDGIDSDAAEAAAAIRDEISQAQQALTDVQNQRAGATAEAADLRERIAAAQADLSAGNYNLGPEQEDPAAMAASIINDATAASQAAVGDYWTDLAATARETAAEATAEANDSAAAARAKLDQSRQAAADARKKHDDEQARAKAARDEAAAKAKAAQDAAVAGTGDTNTEGGVPKASVAGTFSGYRLGSLFAAGGLEQTAKDQLTVAKGTKRTLEQIDRRMQTAALVYTA